MKIDDEIFELITQQPGITGAGIYQALLARSWAGQFFGPDSIWAIIFSCSSASIYPSLQRLEDRGQIRGEWGIRYSERARRRHYYPA